MALLKYESKNYTTAQLWGHFTAVFDAVYPQSKEVSAWCYDSQQSRDPLYTPETKEHSMQRN